GLIAPFEGERRLISAITATFWRTSEEAKGGGAGEACARSRIASRLGSSARTRSRVSARMRPSTPPGGFQVRVDACTSGLVRLFYSSLFLRSQASDFSSKPARARHAAHQAPAGVSLFRIGVHRTVRVRTELRGDCAAVQL